MKHLIVANWKMNPERGTEAKKNFLAIQKVAHKLSGIETVICPPMLFLESLGELVTDRTCVLGAQDSFYENSSAHTGEVSPAMIFHAKARYVIVGHSEQRALGDTDDMVFKKLSAVLQHPLTPIICVGEKKRDERGAFVRLVRKQVRDVLEQLSHDMVKRLVFAYEPIWAIGVDRKRECLPDEAREMIHAIRQEIADVTGSTALAVGIPVLYGGSVNAENAEKMLVDGDASGLLVGNASLDPKTFTTILKIAEKVSKTMK